MSVALLIVGNVAALMHVPRASVLILGTLILIAVPGMIGGGPLWRDLSAPRTLRLVPYGRAQLLLGIVIMIVAVAALLTLEITLFGAPPLSFAYGSFSDVFVLTASVETLVILGYFLGSGSRYLSFLLVLLLLGVRFAKRSAPFAHWTQLGATSIGVWFLASTWGAFAFWYLRAGTISASIWRSSAASTSSPWVQKSSKQINTSKRSALTVHLLGLRSITDLVWRGLVLAGMVGVVVLLYGILGTNPSTPAHWINICLPALLASNLPSFITATGIAHRAKTLWLRGGESREQLFSSSERLSWACFGAFSVPTLALCMATWIFAPVPMGHDWLYLFPAALAPGVCGLYLSLMSVEGWKVPDFIAGLLFGVAGWGGTILALLSDDLRGATTLVPMVAGELLCALIFREIARRRWRRIDWLICKSQALSSQALRPVA